MYGVPEKERDPRSSSTRCRLALFMALSTAVLCSGVAPASAADVQPAQMPKYYGIGEDALRALARSTSLPRVPDGFRPTRPEVAVAQVEIAKDGALVALTIHEAPSADTAKNVLDALRAWRFEGVPLGEKGALYFAKLTFYFVPTPNGVRVMSPQEVLAGASPRETKP